MAYKKRKKITKKRTKEIKARATSQAAYDKWNHRTVSEECADEIH